MGAVEGVCIDCTSRLLQFQCKNVWCSSIDGHSCQGRISLRGTSTRVCGPLNSDHSEQYTTIRWPLAWLWVRPSASVYLSFEGRGFTRGEVPVSVSSQKELMKRYKFATQTSYAE